MTNLRRPPMNSADTGDDFLKHEEDLRIELERDFIRVSDIVIKEVNDALSGAVDLRTLEDVLTRARETFTTLVSDSTVIDRYVRLAMEDGVFSVVGNGSALSGVPSQEMVRKSLTEMVVFYGNTYYETYVEPAFRRQLSDLIETVAPTEPLSGDEIKGIFAGALGSGAYFGVLASVIVSKAYNYGVLKSAQMLRGNRAYKWVSRKDSKTSEICEDMHGREFWLTDAVDLMERTASTFDPTSAKRNMPWPAASQVRGVSNDALRELGFLLPPAHPHCRSKVVPI